MSRVLLIDDTPEIAELLTFSLRDLGYEVFASGYTSAVNELINERGADAVVLMVGNHGDAPVEKIEAFDALALTLAPH